MEFPAGFTNHLKHAEGFDAEKFLLAHKTPPPVSIRKNRKKDFKQNKSLQKIAWCDTGYYLPERPQFTLDPLLHAGCYYVQEASSMFLEYVLKQVADLNASLKVLDLCAAPGGKSTLLSSWLNEKSILVSNEVIRSRVHVLKENVIKWGDANCIITNNDAEDFSTLKNYFDVILVDAPCSGSGLFRKDADAIQEWSKENVLLCSQRQQRILGDSISSLKENGVLIYATCSYSVEENEGVVKKLVTDFGFEILDITIPADWGVVKNNFGFRFYPDQVQGEGFFLSVVQRKKNTDDAEEDAVKRIELNYEKLADEEKLILNKWVADDIPFEFYKKGKMIFASPKNIFLDIQFLKLVLKVVKAGIFCGEIKGKDFIPAHELALNKIVNKNIPVIEVEKETALHYLRKNELKIEPAHDLKSWALIRYKGHNLGWVNVLQNRINNYYPAEWRIKNL